ncbi:MAG TPA: Flp family type IVb pilin [Pirellulales bacterium]|nr:Flp family type IVb pilin [Pirellulales bacterium]
MSYAFDKVTRCATAERNLVMRWLRKLMRRLVREEDGPTTVEYAVMLALIVMVAANAMQTLGCNARATFNDAASAAGS